MWIGKTLDGAPLDDWAVRTFAAWKVGRKGMDDGLAVFVLRRPIARSTSRSVTASRGKVTDALAGRVIQNVMAPKLQAGDRDGAVVAGVDALLQIIGANVQNGAAPVAAPAPAHLPPLPQSNT